MKINKFWESLFNNGKDKKNSLCKYAPVRTVESINDIPREPLDNKMFLVNRGGINRWVVFDCPGGHKKRIEVNLMKSKKPYWTIKVRHGKITLNPSVAVEDKICNCHFWLENSEAIKAYYFHELKPTKDNK